MSSWSLSTLWYSLHSSRDAASCSALPCEPGSGGNIPITSISISFIRAPNCCCASQAPRLHGHHIIFCLADLSSPEFVPAEAPSRLFVLLKLAIVETHPLAGLLPLLIHISTLLMLPHVSAQSSPRRVGRLIDHGCCKIAVSQRCDVQARSVQGGQGGKEHTRKGQENWDQQGCEVLLDVREVVWNVTKRNCIVATTRAQKQPMRHC